MHLKTTLFTLRWKENGFAGFFSKKWNRRKSGLVYFLKAKNNTLCKGEEKECAI